jgi:hypothetical protein
MLRINSGKACGVDGEKESQNQAEISKISINIMKTHFSPLKLPGQLNAFVYHPHGIFRSTRSH